LTQILKSAKIRAILTEEFLYKIAHLIPLRSAPTTRRG